MWKEINISKVETTNCCRGCLFEHKICDSVEENCNGYIFVQGDETTISVKVRPVQRTFKGVTSCSGCLYQGQCNEENTCWTKYLPIKEK